MSLKSHNLPLDAPFDPITAKQISSIISKMSSNEVAWLAKHLSKTNTELLDNELIIIYGTESGNAENLAEQNSEKAKQLGFKTKVINMADITLDQFTSFENFLIIVSTWGEGDPPESATEFYNEFMSDKAPKMDNKNYSVLALGDTSYEHFCKIGKDFDLRLEKLGANRISNRVDCDVDFEDSHNEWSNKTLNKFSELLKINKNTSKIKAELANKEPVKYTRKNPLKSSLKERINLNGFGSSKETVHLEFDLTDSNLTYEVGDSLAVQPINSDRLVDKLLGITQFSPDGHISIKEKSYSLRNALKSQLDITTLSIPFLNRYNAIANDKKLESLLNNVDKKLIQDYINGRDVLDTLTDFPTKNLNPQPFVDLLRKLPPRLYSIASSQKAYPDSVHLTVGVVRYKTHQRDREGVCSTFLADRIKIDSSADVFVTPNKNFKLPENPNSSIIMVGPGTGIAPFRAFIQERKATDSKGKNWLFFGDQHFLSDFLYQSEWQSYQKEGVLSKIDLAFSRDQKEKVYVQDKMKENAEELFRWLESGAYFYVCGDASKMAKDVDRTLHDIIKTQGSFSNEEAEDYVKKLKREKRYLRDVY